MRSRLPGCPQMTPLYHWNLWGTSDPTFLAYWEDLTIIWVQYRNNMEQRRKNSLRLKIERPGWNHIWCVHRTAHTVWDTKIKRWVSLYPVGFWPRTSNYSSYYVLKNVFDYLDCYPLSNKPIRGFSGNYPLCLNLSIRFDNKALRDKTDKFIPMKKLFEQWVKNTKILYMLLRVM